MIKRWLGETKHQLLFLKLYKLFNSVLSSCMDDRSIHGTDHRDRRYVEEYKNDFKDIDNHKHYNRDDEKSHQHHYSKSSHRSKKSSHKRKHKKHGTSCSTDLVCICLK